MKVSGSVQINTDPGDPKTYGSGAHLTLSNRRILTDEIEKQTNTEEKTYIHYKRQRSQIDYYVVLKCESNRVKNGH